MGGVHRATFLHASSQRATVAVCNSAETLQQPHETAAPGCSHGCGNQVLSTGQSALRTAVVHTYTVRPVVACRRLWLASSGTMQPLSR